MGVVMVTVWYPAHRGIEIGNLFLKQPREIPYVSKWRTFTTSDGKKV
jgi:hypothetical protein